MKFNENLVECLNMKLYISIFFEIDMGILTSNQFCCKIERRSLLFMPGQIWPIPDEIWPGIWVRMELTFLGQNDPDFRVKTNDSDSESN